MLRSFWEQDLKHELLNAPLYEEEGPEFDYKVSEPQPEHELEAPANLYQLVRKARDQNRMNELIAMIEDYEDLIFGPSFREAIIDALDDATQDRRLSLSES